ncbi:hypothetical protein AAHE18_02G133400 [Arachis hypogaea]
MERYNWRFNTQIQKAISYAKIKNTRIKLQNWHTNTNKLQTTNPNKSIGKKTHNNPTHKTHKQQGQAVGQNQSTIQTQHRSRPYQQRLMCAASTISRFLTNPGHLKPQAIIIADINHGW